MSKHTGRKRLLFGVLALAIVASACGPKVSAGPGNCGQSDIAAHLVARANGDRAVQGIPPLSWNGQLGCLAAGWSQNLANSGTLVHQDLGAILRSPAYRGFRTLGENLLRSGPGTSADQMHDAWMASSGHQANIMSGAFRWVGIAVVTAPDGTIYVAAEYGG